MMKLQFVGVGLRVALHFSKKSHSEKWKEREEKEKKEREEKKWVVKIPRERIK